MLTLISCQAGSHHDKVIKNAQIEMSKPPADKKDTSSAVFITYISLYKTLSKKKMDSTHFLVLAELFIRIRACSENADWSLGEVFCVNDRK